MGSRVDDVRRRRLALAVLATATVVAAQIVQPLGAAHIGLVMLTLPLAALAVAAWLPTPRQTIRFLKIASMLVIPAMLVLGLFLLVRLM